MQKKIVIVFLVAISLIVACWYVSIPIEQTSSPGFAERPRIKTLSRNPNSSTENKPLTSTETQKSTTSESQKLTSTEKATTAPKTKLTVDEICFAIKTTQRLHKSRVDIILKTWFTKTKGQVNFATDGVNPGDQEKSGNKFMVTGCGKTHALDHLCCKVGHEYDKCMADPTKKWWCHFDDDNYVHVEKLVDYLDQFDTNQDWYIGRKSVPHLRTGFRGTFYTYEFATGGGGVCVSRALGEKMKPYAANGQFPKTCVEAHEADDCIIGFIAHLCGANMTESLLFHSHIEHLYKLNPETLPEQVCVSYSGNNVVQIPSTQPQFTKEEDPTRFLSLHCWIYPEDEFCAKLKKP